MKTGEKINIKNMLKKLSIKTNFILIGIIVGLFVGVSIRQALGDTTSVPGTARADNLTVNTGGQYTNGLIVANGNALVSGNVGIGTITPTVKLDVVGDIKTSSRVCIGTTCINENQLKALLAVGGTGTGGTGGIVTSTPTAATIDLSINGTALTWTSSNTNSCQYNVSTASGVGGTNGWIPTGTLNGSTSLLGIGLSVGTSYTIRGICLSPDGTYGPISTVTYTPATAVTSVLQTLVISSVSPTAVSYGDTVVITGRGFDSNSYVSMANLDPRNSGWTTILPTAYTSTTLTFTIPTVASFGGGFSAMGPMPYKVIEKDSNVSTQLPAPYLFVSTGPVSVNADGTININPCPSGTTGTSANGYCSSTPATINLSISGTTFSWTSSNTNSCQYNVNGGAWMNVSPLNGSFSLTEVGLSVGTTYTISAHCLPSGSSTYGPISTVTYTLTE